ncbi:GNAT family N-acetyltransferase [Prosthecobacter sp.]|uniref:GNAT family N-acetyltransferase n=1 Tax=Prosthecobacter sp. TaxID=1965333 RepID=UPI003783328D
MPATALPTLPITFPVFLADEPASVTVDFADNADVVSATRWRVPRELENNPVMLGRAEDAREFAVLAAKRWRHYRDIGSVAHSQTALQDMIATDPEGEFCFHLKATATWFSTSLGGAMIRRTWCHHLMIDFLFVHPAICGRVADVKGVGIELLRAVCIVARSLGCKRVWGEATRDSAPFYRRQLDRLVEDQFAMEKREVAAFARALESKRQSTCP